jgi:CheY-like chemotaxis protein
MILSVHTGRIINPNHKLRNAKRMGQRIDVNRKALVVEDDAELRFLAVALLEETDLEIVEASSGEEALQYLHHHGDEVAFLFSDVRLPCLMSGVDLARTVSLKWPWIRTVLTSGAPLEEGSNTALRDVRFMPKPWRALEVLIEAEKASDTHHMVEALSRGHAETH